MMMLEGAALTPWEVIVAAGGPASPYVFANGVTYGGRESLELLREWLESLHRDTAEIVWAEDGTLVSMPVDDGAQLILLSATDPAVYQNTEFRTGSVTGTVSLVGSAGDGESALVFRGLGSEAAPFMGSFANSGFTVNCTLFEALDCGKAQFGADNTLTVDWTGDNSAGAIVAKKLIVTADAGAEEGGEAAVRALNVNITSGKQLFRDAAFGEIAGDLALNISFSSGIAFENRVSADPDNAGLVANTVSGGVLMLAVTQFPASVTIAIDGSDAAKNNAGLLVGCLKNASLVIGGDLSPVQAVVQSAQGGAGGIVGRVMTDGAAGIALYGNADLSGVNVLGRYTGGIAGDAANVAFTF
ncbi:MAG: hypothetical protein ACI4XW_00670, partial [Candidatus Spyradocola sp.]